MTELNAAEKELVKRNAPPAKEDKTKRVKIIVEENDDIPPTGLFLNKDDTAFIIKPGEIVEVPEFVCEILDHAVLSTPIIDPGSHNVVGYRDRHRFPYRRVG